MIGLSTIAYQSFQWTGISRGKDWDGDGDDSMMQKRKRTKTMHKTKKIEAMEKMNIGKTYEDVGK